MRRIVMLVMLWAALAMPGLAVADDQPIPPEAHRSPTPPARSMVDVNQLTRVLVEKGIITPHEYAQLTRPQAASPAQHRRARVWTWEEIDRNPVRSTGD
jgi:hypothetical protein